MYRFCIYIQETRILTKVQKWGNNLALRIAMLFAQDAQLENGSLVEISLVEGRIINTHVESPTWTLDEILAGITKKNINHEVDTDSAVGNEVW